MPYKNNSWYCCKCDFYVFNSKSACSKCSTPKPVLKQVEPNIDRPYLSEEEKKEIKEYLNSQGGDPSRHCYVCKNSTVPKNMIPSHNCWKKS